MMRIGFALPLHGSAAGPEGLIAIAKRAEELGFASLWVWERLLLPLQPKAPYPLGDGSHPKAFGSVLDPLAALTFVAGHTRRVALGTSVLTLPLYKPLVLARQITALDVLSRGRVRLGLGVGWNRDEIEASEVPWAERGKRSDEALRLMKAIWTNDPVEFDGEHYRVPRSHIGPKPIQKPHPPIYLAAYSPPAMRRVAREADGWNPVGVPLAAVPEMFAAIREMARESGRDDSRLELVVRANIAPSEKPLGPERPDFHGTLEQIGEDVAKARGAGVTELFFDLWAVDPPVDAAEDWIAWMERLREAAFPQAG